MFMPRSTSYQCICGVLVFGLFAGDYPVVRIHSIRIHTLLLRTSTLFFCVDAVKRALCFLLSNPHAAAVLFIFILRAESEMVRLITDQCRTSSTLRFSRAPLWLAPGQKPMTRYGSGRGVRLGDLLTRLSALTTMIFSPLDFLKGSDHGCFTRCVMTSFIIF